MIAKAGSVSLVMLCALLILPPLAAADSITMRLLGLKDFAPRIDGSWITSEADEGTAAPRFAPGKRVSRAEFKSLLLGYPPVIASHRKVPALPFSESFAASGFSASNDDDRTDGRRTRSASGAGSSGGPAGGGGGYGGLGSTAYGRTLRTALDVDDALGPGLASVFAPADEGLQDRGESPLFAPVGRLTSGDLSDGYGEGGASGSVLDEQLTLSLETNSSDRASWDRNLPVPESHSAVRGALARSAVSAALTDEQFNVPAIGVTPLLDVRPWVSGFTPNAVDEGQFVVVDPVTGMPVWTSAPLDELLDHGSLTPLVPTWEGPDPSLGNIPNPEPASLILFASGLLTVGARVRANYRRSKTRS